MHYSRRKESFTLYGKEYSLSTLKQLIDDEGEKAKQLLIDLYNFLNEWFNDSPTVTVHTSGSTGTPKKMFVDKDKTVQSALSTCNFLNLKPGDKALLCLPLQYIAGKMMVVRAIVAGLDLYLANPSGHPLGEIDSDIDFCAMIPMQVFNSLTNQAEREKLLAIKTLIIGGGAIDDLLADELKELPNKVYSTYGMTETLSHIALRKLNGIDIDENYRLLPSVEISLSKDSTLVIDAPWAIQNSLVTNDIAKINMDGTFSILGRLDNVINSGGVKLQIEEIEKRLKPFIHIPFAITSCPHPKWGEEVVLLLETELDDIKSFNQIIQELPKYWQPHHIVTTNKLPLTGNNKIDRKSCKEIALTLTKNGFPHK